jgi:hypothetical protein
MWSPRQECGFADTNRQSCPLHVQAPPDRVTTPRTMSCGAVYVPGSARPLPNAAYNQLEVSGQVEYLSAWR